jgi:alpha-galactosidase
MIYLIVSPPLLEAGKHASSQNQASCWLDELANFENTDQPNRPILQLTRQDHARLHRGKSALGTPLRIGSRTFKSGLGTHSISDILIWSPDPITAFFSSVGVDHNEYTSSGQGSVVFAVYDAKEKLYQSPILKGGGEPLNLELDTGNTHFLHLRVGDGTDGTSYDYANWANATITLQSGKRISLDDLWQGAVPVLRSTLPFSFKYDGSKSQDLLHDWERATTEQKLNAERTRQVMTWDDPGSGLRVILELTRYHDFPAIEWLLHFENTGRSDTHILEDIQAMDVSLMAPFDPMTPYRLTKTSGAASNTGDFAVEKVTFHAGHEEYLRSTWGRSSNEHFPFFKCESGVGSTIMAIGWSGQWQAGFDCDNSNTLRMTAGLMRARFRLRPGERVRMPRLLIMHWNGDTWEANSRFRELIYKHYAARRAEKRPLPVVFSNTCFKQGGGWLGNLNTAQNQIEMIRAYGPLGLEAVITDAGWMKGSQEGWWYGCGNWTPRKDNYPNGLAPVAEAAHEEGMVYGLWHEIETVVEGTHLWRAHPEWLIDIGARSIDNTRVALLNFGLSEVQDRMIEVVTRPMRKPGLRVYRQDFGLIDPGPHWKANDTPDRQGITEIKYITGLYNYWDGIAEQVPDSLREECAAGGRRIDLETIMRMHIHQKTDFWFHNKTDQLSIWGLSQYLPNNCFVAQLNRLDDYSFHSTMASSLCVGWKADDRQFKDSRAEELVRQYKKVRHLLTGAWYPLTPYSRESTTWLVSQYHRRDLDEGIVLAFRRSQSPYRSAEIALRSLERKALYQVTDMSTGEKIYCKGAELEHRHVLTLPGAPSSVLLHYQRADRLPRSQPQQKYE